MIGMDDEREREREREIEGDGVRESGNSVLSARLDDDHIIIIRVFGCVTKMEDKLKVYVKFQNDMVETFNKLTQV